MTFFHQTTVFVGDTPAQSDSPNLATLPCSNVKYNSLVVLLHPSAQLGSYSLVKHYYNTDEQIIAVLRYYSLDYVRFNISVPTWAARRIGETAALLLAELHPHR